MPCGWEGNRGPGVALALGHRFQWFIYLRANGLRKEERRPPAYTPRIFTVYLTFTGQCVGQIRRSRSNWLRKNAKVVGATLSGGFLVEQLFRMSWRPTVAGNFLLTRFAHSFFRRLLNVSEAATVALMTLNVHRAQRLWCEDDSCSPSVCVCGLPRLCAPGIVPCIISFSRQLPCFLMV